MKVYLKSLFLISIFLLLITFFICSGCTDSAQNEAGSSSNHNTINPSSYNTHYITSKPTSTPTPTSSSATEQTHATPDINNDRDYNLDDIKPMFSVNGGFYFGNPSVQISLSAKDEAALKHNGINYHIKVSYNQEEPTFASANYISDIKLPHKESINDNNSNLNTSILRAAVYDINGNLIGKIQTATYIRNNRSESVSLPVISLVTNNDNLYNEDTGIIPNYSQRGSEWERPVHLEFIEKSGLVISQDAGIRIFGGSSRSLPQKSFRISARKSSYFNESKYDGDGKFKYALFPDRLKENGELLTEFDSFVLRNGGNDSIVNNSQNLRTSFLRDGLSALITSGASNNVDYMAYRPVVVILNGQYYGILNMREHETDNYIANIYDIEDKDNITIISSELDTTRGDRYDGSWFYYKQDKGPEGELDKFLNVLNNIKSGNYTFEQASKYIDMDNFMEYCAINIFTCNTDWPHNNIRVWKYSDGKYKFMLRDADLGVARYTMASQSYDYPSELYTKADAQNLRYLLWTCLSDSQRSKLYNPGAPLSVEGGTYPDPLYIQSLLHFCLQNDNFRNEFIKYCEKLATVLWTPNHLSSLLFERKAIIEIEMKYNFLRWQDFISETNYSYWSQNTIGESMKQWIDTRSGSNGYFLQEIYEVCATY